LLEGHLEDAVLSWFSDLGYECLTGEMVSAGGSHEARTRYSEVVLRPRLEQGISALNPSLSNDALRQAVSKLADYSTQSLIDGNREVYDWIRNGVPVEIEDETGHKRIIRAGVIDTETPSNNDWLVVQQFTVHGAKIRRPDVVLFVNGLPLVVLELKNPADVNADIESAYLQIQTYKADIPQLFSYSLMNVISDGVVARYGSLTADFERYSPWRLIDGERSPDGMLELETLVCGLLKPEVLLDFFKGFVAFMRVDGSPSAKIISQWHQYHGVKKAVERASSALLDTKDGKGGVLWFTQGSGKSLLALFYVMALREREEFANPTVVVVTDRNDLDGQLYETFFSCKESLREEPRQAQKRRQLKEMLSSQPAGGIYFTTINKFAPEGGQTNSALCDRSNVVVITDEAHRTQYGFTAKIDGVTGETKYGLAKHMRDALPNAIYLGMTGTPVSLEDKDTQSVFGTYVDVYDMVAAQEDGAVVPVHYESRIIELEFNEAEKQALHDEFLENTEDEDESEQNRAVGRHTRLEALAMAEGRIEKLAEDLVNHWELRKQSLPGKAMVVSISREAAVALYDEIIKLRPDWHNPNLLEGKVKIVMTGQRATDPEHFRAHHTSKDDRKMLERRFKDPEDELEIVIVRDMWLTGTDAPPCHTLYVDKPMRGHGLMQAIARTNRVWKDKPGGLIVDYIGIGEELKKAIATYTRDSKSDKSPVDVSGEALTLLLDTLDVIRNEFFNGFDYGGYEDPMKALALLGGAMEHITQLHPEPDDKGKNKGIVEYLDQVARLTKSQALAGTRQEALVHRDEIAFFQAVRIALIKLTRSGSGKSRIEKEAALRQLVAKGVLVEGVKDLFGTLGLEKPDISVLDDDFLKQIQDMPTKNLAAELLQRLIADQVKARGQKNAIQAKEFTSKLEEAINKYRNRGITTAQVIEELIALAKEVNEAKAPDGMSEEEYAFYQALIENESAVRELGHPALRALALELTDKLRNSATINWQMRQSAKARMMTMIKVLLVRYKYPPDKQPEATEKVMEQAELLADAWAFERP
jgi:type I restriction enzyme R subunit